MKSIKILIFIDWFLPGYKAGGPVRSIANLIDHLSSEYEFYIFTRNTDYLDNNPYAVSQNQWLDFAHNVKIFYASTDFLKPKNIKSIIEQTNCDIIYINGLFSRYFSILPLLYSKKSSKKIIVAPRGMLSIQAFSRKSLIKKIFFSLTKLFNFYHNAIFHATSIQEATDITNFLPKSKVFNIPNLPRKILQPPNKTRQKTKGTLKLVSIARISQEKNTLFALNILKDITLEGIEFDIYGSIYDLSYWDKCLHTITLSKHVKINYCGTVDTNHIIETFAKYDFAFMPSKAENYGHSILESLIAGTPVIISDTTPWQNLQKQNIGWDIPLSNTHYFKETIEKCLYMEQNEYKTMSETAQMFALKQINNPTLIFEYKKMFAL